MKSLKHSELKEIIREIDNKSVEGSDGEIEFVIESEDEEYPYSWNGKKLVCG